MIDDEAFVNAVRVSVGASLAGFGYELAIHGRYTVRFERSGFFVEVNYDALRSCELSIRLGEANASTGSPLELADALRVSEAAEEDVGFAKQMQTSDLDVLVRLLTRATKLLRGSLGRFLDGDSTQYATARALRSQRAARYTLTVRNAPILNAADEAWAAKDFDQVHALLNPIRDGLEEPHRRRLAFSERRL
jgi:hypothetical protein